MHSTWLVTTHQLISKNGVVCHMDALYSGVSKGYLKKVTSEQCIRALRLAIWMLNPYEYGSIVSKTKDGCEL